MQSIFLMAIRDNPEFAINVWKQHRLQAPTASCSVIQTAAPPPGQPGRICGLAGTKESKSLGIHAHNDSDCAVANSVISVESGAVQVQGTINGIGERCGNANLCSIIPNLQLKLGYHMSCGRPFEKLRDVSRFVNEIANMRHFKRQPFVGDSAFAHKAGIHVSAIRQEAGNL